MKRNSRDQSRCSPEESSKNDFSQATKRILSNSYKRRFGGRLVMVGLCLVSSVSSFTARTTTANGIETTSRTRQPPPNHRAIIGSLQQTTTTMTTTRTRTTTMTMTVQEFQEQTIATVSLNWTDLYLPKTASATPVLLLHGLLGSKRNFASLANSLGHQLETPRRIVGVDLRNHGDSDHAPVMTYTAMAQDVLAFMDDNGLERVVLVGHSMGGKVAQAMSLLHPHRVEGLVVLDIAPVKYTSMDPNWKAVEDILQAMRAATDSSGGDGTHSKSDLDKVLRPTIPDPNLRAFVLTNYDARQKGWKIPIRTICDQLECIADFDIVAHQSYDGDVFIIHGGQSRFVRHAYMDRIAELFPNHMLTTIRGAGHWVHAEAPDDTIALLKRYLDR